MTGLVSYGLWTPEQALELARLVREHEPSHLYVAKGRDSMLDVDMYREDEPLWSVNAAISPAGTMVYVGAAR